MANGDELKRKQADADVAPTPDAVSGAGPVVPPTADAVSGAGPIVPPPVDAVSGVGPIVPPPATPGPSGPVVPPEPPSDSSAKPAPPAPPAPQTPAAPTDACLTEMTKGSIFGRIGVALDFKVEGAEQSYIDGNVYEVLFGGKMSIVEGQVSETHVIDKTELIIPSEIKHNLAATLEFHLAAKLEVITGDQREKDLSGKLHIAPKHGRIFMTGDQLKAAHHKRLIAQCKHDIINHEITLQLSSSTVGSARREIKTLKAAIKSLSETIGTFTATVKDAKIEAASVTRTVNATEMIDAGSIKVNSKGTVKLKGASVQIKGSGAKIICYSKVECSGTKMSVSK